MTVYKLSVFLPFLVRIKHKFLILRHNVHLVLHIFDAVELLVLLGLSLFLCFLALIKVVSI